MRGMKMKKLGLWSVNMVGLLLGAMIFLGAPVGAEETANKLLGISVDNLGASPVLILQTEFPVDYRYTVYDEKDPLRVVIDFPEMDVTAVGKKIPIGQSPVTEAHVSGLNLPSGRLGRVELILEKSAGYDVFFSGNEFRVAFVEPEETVQSEQVSPLQLTSSPMSSVVSNAAGKITDVKIISGQAELQADGSLGKVRSFELTGPSRLVVDVFGMQPAFKDFSYRINDGFDRLRVGPYKDKTRFVFDAASGNLPSYKVNTLADKVVVSWNQGAAKLNASAVAGQTAAVESVDFDVENGRSVFTVFFSGPVQMLPEEKDGNIIRFGVKDGSISRALRRVVDTSAFPSSVRMITPYTVQNGAAQEIRFAAEMKGIVPYSVNLDGNKLSFIAENGPYTEITPVLPLIKEVTAADLTPLSPAVTQSYNAAPSPTKYPSPISNLSSGNSAGRVYTGERITLVFDDADVRNLLQLIAEVSQLNIIASDDVKGTLTLRLIDVPWDQALDLMMEIKGLGMLQDGNVVRVLPKEKIRAMREAELSASRAQEKLEDLVTEVVSISYTDLKNVSGPARELLSERGKITEDARNKQLIVRDIASAVTEIKNLAAILDTPERQVMIEARIVEADSSFSRDLGVKWGLSYTNDNGGPWNASTGAIDLGGSFLLGTSAPGSVSSSAGMGSSITFGTVGVDSTILDLRISALETAGHGKIVSTPRVSTLNGEEATISQGTTIPYQSTDDSGAAKTEFVDANLELKVTPVINPDNSIILQVEATNSSPGINLQTASGGEAPQIDTKEAKTKMLIHDGETTVIGGIFVENEDFSEAGVPFLMNIPLLGNLFKSTSKTSQRSELLIFITPHIIQ